jgi:hypothetical protein
MVLYDPSTPENMDNMTPDHTIAGITVNARIGVDGTATPTPTLTLTLTLTLGVDGTATPTLTLWHHTALLPASLSVHVRRCRWTRECARQAH